MRPEAIIDMTARVLIYQKGQSATNEKVDKCLKRKALHQLCRSVYEQYGKRCLVASDSMKSVAPVPQDKRIRATSGAALKDTGLQC